MTPVKPCKFGHQDRYPDGRCRTCKILRAAEWAKANPDKRQQIQKKYYDANYETTYRSWLEANRDRKYENNRRWNEANPDQLREIKNNWMKAHPENLARNSAKRRAQKLRATPAWLVAEDYDRISQIYAEAARMTRETGVVYHVDHEIPLQGKTVSGLHVPENLRILPAVENFRKGNRLQ